MARRLVIAAGALSIVAALVLAAANAQLRIVERMNVAQFCRTVETGRPCPAR